MKKVKFILSLMVVLATSAVITSCGNDDPEPEVVETPNPDCSGSLAQEGTIVDGKITTFPFTVSPTFVPSGVWAEGSQEVVLGLTCENQNITLVYTKPSAAPFWFGASFINENDWTRYFSIDPSATKITFEAKFDYNATVALNAFGNATKYGSKTLTKKATPVTPVWETFTIDLLDTPEDFDGELSEPETTGFNAPLSIVIENTEHLTAGQTVTVQLRNIKFETTAAPARK